jgi:hypothetical protein
MLCPVALQMVELQFQDFTWPVAAFSARSITVDQQRLAA